MSNILVTGVTGQAGKYLTELLINEGHNVYGMVRRTSGNSTDRIKHLLDKITLVSGDLEDEHSLVLALEKSQPDIVYNLAAQSLVPVSWKMPIYTISVTGLAVVKLLNAIKNINPKIKFLQISSSEMFGSTPPPQSETTTFHPRSPYACAKCLTARTKIYTDKGLKNIKDIVIGDNVWTHTGQLKKVTKTFSRKKSDELIVLTVSPSCGEPPEGIQSNFQITVTLEHPVLTERGWMAADKLSLEDKVAVVATSCKMCGDKIPANRQFCSMKCRSEHSWKFNDGYREKITNITRKRFKENDYWHTDKAIKNRNASIAKRLKIKGMNYMEYYVDLLIQSAAPGFFKFVGDGKVCIEGCFPDWINDDKKAIIEFIAYKEGMEDREQKLLIKIEKFIKEGYKVLVLRGSEFNKPNILKEKVAQFCSNLGSIEFVYEPIKRIKRYQSKNNNFVYNLEVEEDESYVANGIICHNCLAHHATINYRESYNMFAATAICFNYESPERGIEFVTKKITDGVAKIKKGEVKKLMLGNLDARRDWGFVGDTVRAMSMIVNYNYPDDFVVATGETHSVREFAELAFNHVGLNYQDYVEIDQSLIRPAEVSLLLGNASKIKDVLGWEPTVKFKELVYMMMDAEFK